MIPEDDFVVPVMIGYDRAFAVMLRRRFGRLHIFSESYNPFLRLIPFMHFHRVFPRDPSITALYLRDLSEKSEGRSLLVTATGENEGLLRSLAPLIEDFCFVAPIGELSPSGKETI